jgi:hypothetical protein
LTALRYSAHWEEYFGSNNLTHCCSIPNLKKGFRFPKLWNVSKQKLIFNKHKFELLWIGNCALSFWSSDRLSLSPTDHQMQKRSDFFACEAAYFECKCFLKLIICLNLDQLIQGKVSSLLFVIIHDRNNNWFSNRFKTAD